MYQLHIAEKHISSWSLRAWLLLRTLAIPFAETLHRYQPDDLAAQRRAWLAFSPTSKVPVLVDGDTGYGEALNVMHMVRTFEEAGAAAVHLEDQLLPKKCGHLNDKKLAGADDMAAKVAAARKARKNLVIIARTDAAASEGIDGAVARAKLYVQAGADAIFPEALNTREMFEEFARRMNPESPPGSPGGEGSGVKLLANMTEFGRTPFLTAAEFAALGYKIVIWPVSALRCAARAQADLYTTLARDGSAEAMLPRMQTRKELYATIGYHDFEALDASIISTVLPPALNDTKG